jgi:hypothetical protein
MNFIYPGAFSFLALIPLIILFYLLKLRRKPVIVSNIFLWVQSFSDARADKPFQKLRNNLLLILQILALLLLIFTRARPYINTKFQGGDHIALILDNSASMQSIETGKTRFKEAQNSALKLVEQMNTNDQMMVISISSRARVESTFTHNKGNLSKIIKAIKPFDCSTNIRDALVLASASLKNYPDGKIFLLSDGAFPQIEDLGNVPNIIFLPFGTGCNNAGITNINLRSSPFSRDIEVLVEIGNFSDEKKEFSAELYLEDELIDAHKISLGKGEIIWEIFQGINAQKGKVNVKIDIKDSLSLDNNVYAVISPPGLMKILLVTRGNPFLEHLLAILPGLQVFISDPSAYSSKNSSEKTFDLVIFDGGELPVITGGNFVFLGTKINTDSFKITGEIEKPPVIAWDKEHPVMRFVDFSDIHIEKAFKITEPSGKVLLEARETPLICSIIEEKVKAIFIGFTIYNSDLILRPAFPILFSNIIQYFNHVSSDRSDLSEKVIKTGNAIKISNYNVKIITPGGSEIKMDGKRNFSDTFNAGIYRVKYGKEEKYIAANLMDSMESNIKPVKTILIGKTCIGSSTINKLVRKEFWKILAFLVLILLTLEWYVFHKKVT